MNHLKKNWKNYALAILFLFFAGYVAYNIAYSPKVDNKFAIEQGKILLDKQSENNKKIISLEKRLAAKAKSETVIEKELANKTKETIVLKKQQQNHVKPFFQVFGYTPIFPTHSNKENVNREVNF